MRRGERVGEQESLQVLHWFSLFSRRESLQADYNADYLFSKGTHDPDPRLLSPSDTHSVCHSFALSAAASEFLSLRQKLPSKSTARSILGRCQKWSAVAGVRGIDHDRDLRTEEAGKKKGQEGVHFGTQMTDFGERSCSSSP